MSEHKEELPDNSKLEEQLASVIEGEGLSYYSNDGIHLMIGPSRVQIKNANRKRRRRRRRRPAEQVLPAISQPVIERRHDEVASYDKVIVGFQKRQSKDFKTYPVSISHRVHDRSPYVVSLRDLTFYKSGPAIDERLSQDELFDHEVLPISAAPSLELLETLAHDLNIGEHEAVGYAEQFTPTQFGIAYASSYGTLSHLFGQFTSGFQDVMDLFRKRTAVTRTIPSARKPEPETEPIAIPKFSYVKTFAGIAGLIIVATLPANSIRLYRSLASKHVAIATAGQEAIAEIQTVDDTDLADSIDALRRASARFRSADETLNQTNALAVGLASLLPEARSTYQTAKALIEVGTAASDAGALLAKGLEAALSSSHRNALDRFQTFTTYAEGAMPLLEDAGNALSKIDLEVIPPEHQQDIVKLSAGIDQARIAIREFRGLAELMNVALGSEGMRRYIIVFQNPHELRPTGGFMGSYAELDMTDGEITRLDIPGGGTYDLQGQLIAQVIPPEPLTLIADRWEFQDSNWSPDFSAAAQKMNYFWSKSGGYTIDGIIAINATIVPKLLRLTGPIEVEEFGKTITEENFMFETQKAVELEYDEEENQPKKILSLMAPKLLAKLKELDHQGLMQAMGIMSESLIEKDIQIALFDEEENEMAQSFGWSGQLKNTVGDSLAIIGANIAGQKTDAAMHEEVTHSVEINEDGKIIDNVTITRRHDAIEGTLFQGVRNVTYFRVYVPQGSTLLGAKGFEKPEAYYFDTPRSDAVIDETEAEINLTKKEDVTGIQMWDEMNRTVFGGWSLIDPGETKTYTLSYKLPFTVYDLRDRLSSGPEDETDTEERVAYSLLLTSQSGKPDRVLHTSVSAPDHWQIKWSHAGEVYDGLWNRDRVISTLYVIE